MLEEAHKRIAECLRTQNTELNLFDCGFTKQNHLSELLECVHLDKLFLGRNQITDISFLSNLTNLNYLNLSWNQITDISFLSNLTKLNHLDLSWNQITDHSFLSNLTNLSDLSLDSNQITDISFLSNLSKLSDLSLRNNQITDHSFLSNLTNLSYLYLERNQITDLSFLLNLINLSYLDLNSNRISDLSFLSNLTNLSSLNLETNKITDISYLSNLTNLNYLNLSWNQITDISFLSNLTKLSDLSLGSNQITDISFLSNLTKLSSLNLWKNKISDISLSCINKYPKLRDLQLFENSLTSIPKEITEGFLKNSLVPLKTYLQDLEKGKVKNNEVKVIFIGNGSVGKTQIANRLVEQTDFVFDAAHNSTHGITLLRRKMDCEGMPYGLQLNLWDFAGQDIYHATHRLFMQTQALFVLVWDLENEQSDYHTFEGKHYKNEKLQYWLEYARCFGKNSPVLVVQNKVDTEEDCANTYPKGDEAFKSEYPAIHEFIQVSAKTGLNFDVFEYHLQDIFNSNNLMQNELLKELPFPWTEVRKRVREEQARGTKEIDFETFTSWCDAATVKDSTPVIADFFHNSGVFYYRSGYFGNRIILNQSWAIDAVYAVLDRQSIYFRAKKIKKGRLDYNLLCEIWKNRTDSERELFIQFMLSCELCFETTENKQHNTPLADRTFVVPSLLPEEKPAYLNAKYGVQLTEKHTISYRFLPAVFIQRFIVKAKLFTQAQVEDMWQSGVLVQQNAQLALVEAMYAERQIQIAYNLNAQTLVNSIVEELDLIANEGEVKPQKPSTHFDDIRFGETYIKGLAKYGKTTVTDLIKQNDIEKAFAEGFELAKDNKELYNKLTILSASYRNNETNNLKGIVNHSDYLVERAKIINALNEFLSSQNL